MSITITEANFDQEVLQSDSIVVIDCYADWCQPCQALKPVLLELEEENKEVKLGFLNVDKNHKLAERLKISSIPKVFVFCKGEEVAAYLGIKSKSDYQELIDDLLAVKS